ncbi:5'-deoxynucleotidase HDDC2 [Linum perenne]
MRIIATRAAVLCKSSSLFFLTLSSSSSVSAPTTRFRFNSFSASSSPSPSHYNRHRMAAAEISPSDAASPSSAIDFLSLCHRLKTTKRAGWVKRDVRDPESIADHMYRMGLMGLILPDIPGIDRDKCVKMAIVHDIAEAIVGDITPSDGVPKEEKSRKEAEALDHMCKLLGGGSRAKEIEQLWKEYEDNSSPEAKLVKDFDKVEMILQALEYENEQGKDLEEFFQSTAGKFQTDVGKAWAMEIASRRKGK